jgi:hypothetical protein
MTNDISATVGELRRRLAERGDPWQVQPSLADDDPLPGPPRGGSYDDIKQCSASGTAADYAQAINNATGG